MSVWKWVADNATAVVIGSLAVLSGLWKSVTWVFKIDRGEKDFRDFVQEIRADIKDILKAVQPTTKPGSPLTLTELGLKVADALGADAWASDLAPRLLDQVQDRRPHEIDDFCRSHVESDLTEEMRNLVSKNAYDFGITQDSVRAVLHVVLRDELLRITGQSEPAGDPDPRE